MINTKGFTLIEIIAVLVILGILMAVAIPRYINLQEEARSKAIKGALAAGISQLTMQYATDLLKNQNDATASTWNYGPVTNVKLGDFMATLTGNCGNNGAKVEITGTEPGWITNLAEADKKKEFTICGN